MLPYIVAAVVGGIFVKRKGPAVAGKKKTVLGSRTGITYELDDISAAGLVLVKAPEGTVATFSRKTPPDFGFDFVTARGNPKVVDLIKKDFES